MLSYWESESFLKHDVVIIGGGIVGMSVAASIAERNPDTQITILERSIFPYGASTRNAGFACFGSLTEILADIETMGEEAARDLLFQRWMGLQITRKRLGDTIIGFEELGGFELIPDTDNALNVLEKINELVADFIPEYLSDATNELERFGLKQSNHKLIRMAQEGQVNTGQLIRSLQQYVSKLGVEIRTGVEVKAISEDGTTLSLLDHHRNELTITCNKSVICTNAFTSTLLPNAQLVPGRGQVFITKPLQNLEFQGNLHLDEGYYYLRSVGNRIMFGGARNLAFKKEETTQIALNEEIQQHLEDYLKQLFGFDTVEIEQRWAGIMAFGSNKIPIVEQLTENKFIAVKMGGMGIALAGFIGEELADLMNG